jgi:branched-chain amino acid transport system ATP-binding protein
MTDLLACVGVQKHFGDFVATKGIDLTIDCGEIVGIIGANGAGKTTLLNIISGYLRPDAGKIIFQGADVTGTPPRILVRQGIARSFQIPQLFTRSTALQNMMLALSLLVEPTSSIMQRFEDVRLAGDARHVLASYGIDQHADMVVGLVPQGVRKLLDIAMATCAHPKLVLLDEPTSGVSSEEKHGLMQRLVERFTAASTTAVFIEHDMDIVRQYSSRVVALCDGEIIADASADDVFADAGVIQRITGQPKSARAT